MGIQSYSLRSFGLDDALAKTQQLGLNYWESFSSHIPLTNDPAELAEIKSKLAARNVTLRAWGVHAFDGDEAAARRVFEFADALGLEAISADPTPEALPILDKLVNDFKIHIAIHNHGPGSRYDKLESVLRALKDRSPGMGVCVDTGHTLRSGEDPVEWVKTLGPRVHGMHLKDVLDRSKWVVFGKGDLDAVALFKELLRIPFHGVMSLEYEENPRDPIPEIEACLAAVRDAIAKAKTDR
jgi:sugar phosphate isomerase/epimerase